MPFRVAIYAKDTGELQACSPIPDDKLEAISARVGLPSRIDWEMSKEEADFFSTLLSFPIDRQRFDYFVEPHGCD